MILEKYCAIIYSEVYKMELDENYFSNKNGYDGNNRSIQDIVNETGDEQLLWTGKPNKKIYILERVFKMMPLALLWLAIDLTFIIIISFQFANGNMPLFVLAFIIPFFCVHLMPFWMWIYNIATASRKLKNTEYGFTDKRIIIKSGYFVDVTSIYYADINSVKLNVGFLDRKFKVGDIHISANSGRHVLEDLEDPYFLTEKLQHIVLDIKADIQFPNDFRPKENSGFNTQYKDKD